MRLYTGPLYGLIVGWLMLGVGAFGLRAQAPPDCTVTASFTATGTSAAAFNKSTLAGGTPCTYWTVSYWTNNASSVSVQMEGTNDVGGSAGTVYTALTAVAGTNPMTGTNEGASILCCDYYPWVRFNLGTFTGAGRSMIIRAYGFRTQTSAPATSGNVTIVAPIGQKTMAASVSVAIASNQSTLGVNALLLNGITPDVNSNGDLGVTNSCTTFAAFNLSGSGNTQIVAASAAKKIIVCSVDFATATPEDIKFTEGTGSNCGAGTADVTGLYKNISARSHDAMALPYTASAGDALCINQAGTQALGGTIWYRYQ